MPLKTALQPGLSGSDERVTSRFQTARVELITAEFRPAVCIRFAKETLTP